VPWLSGPTTNSSITQSTAASAMAAAAAVV
jgi:hypothetical protein